MQIHGKIRLLTGLSSQLTSKQADKGNCFVVMDRSDYDKKMQDLLDDQQTYEKVSKPPFKKIERELNAQLLQLKHD
jgi:hypothetical protein